MPSNEKSEGQRLAAAIAFAKKQSLIAALARIIHTAPIEGG
jgi:hypothetical protein